MFVNNENAVIVRIVSGDKQTQCPMKIKNTNTYAPVHARIDYGIFDKWVVKMKNSN